MGDKTGFLRPSDICGLLSKNPTSLHFYQTSFIRLLLKTNGLWPMDCEGFSLSDGCFQIYSDGKKEKQNNQFLQRLLGRKITYACLIDHISWKKQIVELGFV